MKKVLVIDDEIEILYVVEIILKHNRFIVKTLSEWSGIAKTIEDFAPDIILLDIDLNGADGGDICKKLKLSKQAQQIPIILFSGYKLTEKYVKESHAQGFLLKPFESSNLVKIISDNLN